MGLKFYSAALVLVLMIGCTTNLFTRTLRVARLSQIDGGKDYIFRKNVKDNLIGWTLGVSYLDVGKDAPMSRIDQWKRLRVDTTLSVTVKNLNDEPIFLSRQEAIGPGEDRTFVVTNFTGSAAIARLSGHARPGDAQNDYSIEVKLRFEDDIEYAPGLWVGFYSTDGF